MATNVIINLQIEGLHLWKDAINILPQVGYLSDLHRHIFYITLKKAVFHDDRDIEFIDFKHKVKKYINKKYFSKQYECCLFGEQSCEMIARELLDKFNLEYCSVIEDNENGAEIYK